MSQIFLTAELLLYATAQYISIVMILGQYTLEVTLTDYIRLMVSVVLSGLYTAILFKLKNIRMEKSILERRKINEHEKQTGYAKDMFLANVSHDIRTPLNAIMGTEGLIMEMNTPAHVKENIQYIYNSSKAMLTITDDLLDFSMMDLDHVLVQHKKYYLFEILENMINVINMRIMDTGIDLEVEVDPFIPDGLTGDSDKIRLLYHNILNPVLKQIREGQISLSFSMDKAQESIQLYCEILVQTRDRYDNQEGISFDRRLLEAMGSSLQVK
ncbi:MAG: histidine kinase dimerization/phospho-acceptor domain-containing protein [Lachnospiraceae bacterium]|nr:histidine kinase dimerization/phospho-acceptor domain-containing protein [Lachnospiraceae bacterium]